MKTKTTTAKPSPRQRTCGQRIRRGPTWLLLGARPVGGGATVTATAVVAVAVTVVVVDLDAVLLHQLHQLRLQRRNLDRDGQAGRGGRKGD